MGCQTYFGAWSSTTTSTRTPYSAREITWERKPSCSLRLAEHSRAPYTMPPEGNSALWPGIDGSLRFEKTYLGTNLAGYVPNGKELSTPGHNGDFPSEDIMMVPVGVSPTCCEQVGFYPQGSLGQNMEWLLMGWSCTEPRRPRRIFDTALLVFI